MELSRIESLHAARAYLDAARSVATRRAYAHEWESWLGWCRRHAQEPLPATEEDVAEWLAEGAHEGRARSSLLRRRTVLSLAHQAAHLDDPTKGLVVRDVLRGIARVHGTEPTRAKIPATADVVVRLLDGLDGDDLATVRDRALVLVGFAAALRRDELARLRVEHLSRGPGGLELLLVDAKTGTRRVRIAEQSVDALCPVRSLERWLAVAKVYDGPVFRSIGRALPPRVGATALQGRAIAAVVKRLAHRAGLDPRAFGAHSLRSGLATTLAAQGAADREIRSVTGHRSPVALESYVRPVRGWGDVPRRLFEPGSK